MKKKVKKSSKKGQLIKKIAKKLAIRTEAEPIQILQENNNMDQANMSPMTETS